MKVITFLLLLTSSYCSFGQTVSYNDVAVIVNDYSQTSIAIGAYFQQKRNIPNQNIIHITAPTAEAIDSLQFEEVRGQIENYLISNNLVDSFNYLVTTKGIPLEIVNSCFDSIIPGVPTQISCASFDSELTLLLSANAFSIGQSGSWANPVYGSTQHFSRANAGIYLVTRLDGYNIQDVYDLIDRSGPSTGINKLSAQAIVDLNASSSADSLFFMDNYLSPVNDYLVANAWNVQLDLNVSTYLNQTNVFAYFYEGDGPIATSTLNYDWTEGSIGALGTCGTASTFNPSIDPDALMIADLIAEGCTGAHGNVNCLYYSQLLNGETLVNRYLDLIENYNLAESFYMAEPRLSWQAVIVGDPKTSVILDDFATIDDAIKDQFSIYPNPSSGNVTIVGNGNIGSIALYDMRGAQVAEYNQPMNSSVELDLDELGEGVYIIQAKIGDSVIRERIVIRN